MKQFEFICYKVGLVEIRIHLIGKNPQNKTNKQKPYLITNIQNGLRNFAISQSESSIPESCVLIGLLFVHLILELLQLRITH